MQKSFNEFLDLDKRIGKILICGDEGSGKTLLTTYISVQKMLHGEIDKYKSYEKVEEYNSLGYNFTTTYEHLLFANYDINTAGTRIPDMKNYILDPFRVGLFCNDYETDFYPPGALFTITEAHIVFNSHKWLYVRPEVQRFWETARQAGIDLIMDTNRPGLIFNGVRDLCDRVIYLWKSCDEIKNVDGEIVGHKLYVREFKKYNDLALYLKDTRTNNYVEYTLILNKCVYENYDSYQCRYIHILGRENQDFRIEYFPKIKTIEDVNAFAKNFGARIPEVYYVTDSPINKSQEEEKVDDDFDLTDV